MTSIREMRRGNFNSRSPHALELRIDNPRVNYDFWMSDARISIMNVEHRNAIS